MKRRFLYLLVTAIVFNANLAAQTGQEQAVAGAVEGLRKAMVDGDKEMLEKISHDSLTYGHSSGKIESKASFVENIISGNADYTSIDLTGQTIYITGKTAIVRHRLNATIVDKDKKPGNINVAVMGVWQKEKKQWKLLARQAIKLP